MYLFEEKVQESEKRKRKGQRKIEKNEYGRKEFKHENNHTELCCAVTIESTCEFAGRRFESMSRHFFFAV